MAKALLLVDMSKDFIYLDGSLNCGPAGMSIVGYCRELVRSFLDAGHIVIDARDLHHPDDYEIRSGLFPPHNIEGTHGQELIDELAQLLQGRPDLWVRVFKKHYNACFRTPLCEILRQHGVRQVHVVGVCTDICVRYTVSGLYDWKVSEYPELEIVVHERGVASFNEVGHADSLRHFRQAFGVNVC
ncbi:MAG: cysteine hydrolase [Alicyclobacillaceae bacterium]|nr:cysteine hydrolase [Alicyclobacillaceae bacterium]